MPAIRRTISFTVAGTIDSFDAAGVKDRLRSYLQCFEPDCTVELRLTEGSVNVEAVVTDARDKDSSTATVEAAATLSRESEAELTKALGVTVQGDVTVSAPSSVMVQDSKSEVEDAGDQDSKSEVEDAGESAIDAGNNEDSAGSIVGVVAGGVVGGVVVLSGLIALGLCAFKRSQDKKKKAQPTLTAESAQTQPVEAETSHVTITRTITSSQGGDKQAAGPSAMPVATPAPPTEMPVASPQSMAALLAACGLEQHTGAFEAVSYTLESLLEAMKQGDDAAMRDLRALKLNMGECRKLIQAATETRPASGSMDVAVHRV